MDPRKRQAEARRTEARRLVERREEERGTNTGKARIPHRLNSTSVPSVQWKVCSSGNIGDNRRGRAACWLTCLAVSARGPQVFHTLHCHMVNTENTPRIHHRAPCTRGWSQKQHFYLSTHDD